ncbi:hypothetical protein KUTeg_018597 [Tegillarca granosa]|uniref:Uncharacterized protein n=1 Tax=Tegillarca granosa TaxID=220873 RepID=A0ABQ9EI69_TEGGR|nr:hypothetical protein KUTeg_018597 [Tegillarca granosa]
MKLVLLQKRDHVTVRMGRKSKRKREFSGKSESFNEKNSVSSNPNSPNKNNSTYTGVTSGNITGVNSGDNTNRLSSTNMSTGGSSSSSVSLTNDTINERQYSLENDHENLNDKVEQIFREELGIGRAIPIDRIHRTGPPPSKFNKFPRAVIATLHEPGDRELILTKSEILRDKNLKIRINVQYPESIREKRKRLFDVQGQLNKQNIDTKVSGDKLIFKRSGTLFREKVELPKATDVFHSALYVKINTISPREILLVKTAM